MTTTLRSSGSGSRKVLRQVLRRQVAAHQELSRLEDAGRVLVLQPQLHALDRAGRDEDGVEVALELLERHVLADADAEDELDAEVAQPLDAVGDADLVLLEVGDAVVQQPARHRPGVVDDDAMAGPRDALGDADAGGPGADDREALARRGRSHGGRRLPVGELPLRHERLELADGDRLALLADDAMALAKPLLGAEPSTHLGQLAGLAEDVGGAVEVALFEQPEGGGDVVADGAGDQAGGGGALDAAGRLGLGGLGVEEVEDLVPVAAADLGWLLVRQLRLKQQPRLAIDVRALRALRGRGGRRGR